VTWGANVLVHGLWLLQGNTDSGSPERGKSGERKIAQHRRGTQIFDQNGILKTEPVTPLTRRGKRKIRENVTLRCTATYGGKNNAPRGGGPLLDAKVESKGPETCQGKEPIPALKMDDHNIKGERDGGGNTTVRGGIFIYWKNNRRVRKGDTKSAVIKRDTRC